MTRKVKSDDYIEPMPKQQFLRIVKAFKATGGVIQMGDETDRRLYLRKVEGLTYNENTILLKQNPSRAVVFEELIHATQYRLGENNGGDLDRILCEIKAQEKLLRNQKAYKLTQKEIFQTQKALNDYNSDLEEFYRNGGS